MQVRYTFEESTRSSFPLKRVPDLIDALSKIHSLLRPRLSLFSIEGQSVVFKNLIGSFALSNGDVVEVVPRTASTNWTSAVVDLLHPQSRVALTSSHKASFERRPLKLSHALASEYARRLGDALRRDGPLLGYVRVEERNRRLNGQLDVTSWTKTAFLDPAVFPVRRDELTANNEISRALSVVAGLLSSTVGSGPVANKLNRLQREVLPGHPTPVTVNKGVTGERLAPQWKSYQGAWDIAVAILEGRGASGYQGSLTGFEVAVEPWLLLETQLHRLLTYLAASSHEVFVGKKIRYPVLHSANGDQLRQVEPDGMLVDDSGQVLATFEAKYSVPKNGLDRAHIYQALTTAAALSAPVAVVVYPTDAREEIYETVGFHGTPKKLVAMGLSTFTYEYGRSERLYSERIKKMLGF